MSDDTYNGWSNWDTWNVNLYLTNDEWSYKAARAVCRRNTSAASAEFGLRDIAKSAVPESEGIDWGAVDFEEIYNSFNEE